jgi:nucleotide-binding universal stress UspA family protein
MTPSDKTIPPFEVEQAIVGLELGVTDETVLPYFYFFARQVPVASAYFLHVLPEYSLFDNIIQREERAAMSTHELNSEVIRKMKTKLETDLTEQPVKSIDFDVREGNPLKELLKEAEEMNADLLVIGQNNAAGPHGIMARNLARKANSNVLIIPGKATAQIRRMLIPIDFSPMSVKSLKIALALNRRLDTPAEIVCANVFQTPSVAAYRIGKTSEELREIIVQDRMSAFRDFLYSHGVTEEDQVVTELIENVVGDIGTYLYDYASENAIDLIVIGAKGHSTVERLLLGSVTERLLVQNNTVPTFVIK